MEILESPLRNLISVTTFMVAVVVLSTLAYLSAGWNFRDAFYMVVLTVWSVGYNEVRPIDTPFLQTVTVGTIMLGCTGMIFFTGALVQFFTVTQLQQILGHRRVLNEIDRLHDHVIVCGYGRIGVMLAQGLKAGGSPFVVVENDEKRAASARDAGYLCLVGDATSEESLMAAHVDSARLLATVLPNDAFNIFITLTARGLNPKLEIIARGEMPSTESKLIQAGANRVVLPTHIGAERIVELILFPESARFIRGSERMRDLERSLRGLGLDMEVVVVPERGALTGRTIEDIEQRVQGAFFIVQLNRRDGDSITQPDRSLSVSPGDGVVIVGRNTATARAFFDAPPERVRAGRTTL